MCFKKTANSVLFFFLTLSLLGYLKTRICWGGRPGGSIWRPPPSNSHVYCLNLTTDTLLESSCVLLLESEKKNRKFSKTEFFIAKSSYLVKMFAKKNLSKKWKILHFWKALFHAISNMQKILHIWNGMIFNQEKLKMCKFPLIGCLRKNAIFLQNLCNSFPYVKAFFQKAKFYQNLTSGSGSKQRFSFLLENVVIQAVCLRTQAVSIKAW